MGKYTFPKITFGTTPPTVDFDETGGYIPGTLYINTATNERFQCVDSTEGAAVWFKLIDYVNPADGGITDFQAEIDNRQAQRSLIATPQVFFQDGLIDYNLEIPGNALSVGPITIAADKTVTVGPSGSWAVI